MQAKVKDSYFLPMLTAFSGLEFTNKEWRDVPAEFEEEAKSHPFLDLQDDKGKAIKVEAKEEPFQPLDVVDVEEPEPIETVKKIFSRRRSKKQEDSE